MGEWRWRIWGNHHQNMNNAEDLIIKYETAPLLVRKIHLSKVIRKLDSLDLQTIDAHPDAYPLPHVINNEYPLM